ncbi:MAG: hydrogenase maturation nickel metallochaperone HypA [Cyanobacteria bacterium REEB459]|nr:hydrogenase maturation nickel metallochaperone HypA [Cyanobacteria bacterium REEB459]
MHELSLTQTIITTVLEVAAGQPVQRIVLEIGQLSGVLPESIDFCFAACAAQTPLAGAQLDLVVIPGRGCCRDCGHQMDLDIPYGMCDRCGSLAIAVIAGQSLLIKSLEMLVCV